MLNYCYDHNDCYLRFYQSALCGNFYDQYRLADSLESLHAISTKDAYYWYNRAITGYTGSKKNNSFESQFMLARFYYWGKGVEVDLETAFDFFSKAIGFEFSHLIRYNINSIYNNKSLPYDRIKSIEQFTITAEKLVLIKSNINFNIRNIRNLAHIVSKLQFELAECFYYGLFGIKEDKTKAVEWFIKSAQNGDRKACTMISQCYYSGIVVPKNKRLAYIWQKVSYGNANYQYSLAHSYEYGIDLPINIDKAAIWYQKAAKYGSAKAECALANCYLNGKGLKKDNDRAFKLYEDAAKRGNSKAQYNLAYCYRYGKGCPADSKQAYKWYLTAAEQGYVKAQYCVALCYEYGIGVNQDYLQSIDRYKKLMNQGDSKSKNRIKKMRIDFNDSNAKKFLSDTQYEFADKYYNCQDINLIMTNKQEAVEWYTASAENGNIEAQFKLAEIYDKGEKGILRNLSESIKWYKILSDEGDCRAKKRLAQFYEMGYGVPQDSQEALRLYNEIDDKEDNDTAKRGIDRVIQNSIQHNTESLGRIENKLDNISYISVENYNISRDTNLKVTEMQIQLEKLNTDIENKRQELLQGVDLEKDPKNLISVFFEEAKKAIYSKLKSNSKKIVDEEESKLAKRYGKMWGKLDSNTKISLVSAKVLWSKCCDINQPFNYCGVCICATAALENELKCKLFTNFQKYIFQKEKNLSKWPSYLTYETNNKLKQSTRFNLGICADIFAESEKNNEWREGYLSTIIAEEKKDHYNLHNYSECFTENYFGNNSKSLLDQIDEIRSKYRNEGAHGSVISRDDAESCCCKIMGKFEAVSDMEKIDCILMGFCDLLK